ncbi:MAG: hypothetical protein BGO31_13145 [Bacteroidetes bacterium 43-16]|nr:MAG: hypothetical protein BGO31_13145 [Bacteroidetes bacterium 43-16]
MNKHKLSLFLTAICCSMISFFAQAQQEMSTPPLPDFNLVTKDGFNIITFYNAYESGVKVITVQRSADSNVNFTTIGTVASTKKGNAVFVDTRPMVGKNWYQVTMEFNSGVDFKSNLRSIMVDSAMIAQQKPLISTEDLQKAANKALEESKPIEKVVESQAKELSFPKSRYVFSNPFTGNINIELNDAITTSYKLEFFDSNKKKVLSIPRINEKVVILDKRNFNQLGLYSFKLYKNGTIFEEGFISIY